MVCLVTIRNATVSALNCCYLQGSYFHFAIFVKQTKRKCFHDRLLATSVMYVLKAIEISKCPEKFIQISAIKSFINFKMYSKQGFGVIGFLEGSALLRRA